MEHDYIPLIYYERPQINNEGLVKVDHGYIIAEKENIKSYKQKASIERRKKKKKKHFG